MNFISRSIGQLSRNFNHQLTQAPSRAFSSESKRSKVTLSGSKRERAIKLIFSNSTSQETKSVRAFQKRILQKSRPILPYTRAELEQRERIRLKDILDNKVLKEPLAWHQEGIMRLSADLGNDITADVYPGCEDTNTTVVVSRGEIMVCQEISGLWLQNWTVK